MATVLRSDHERSTAGWRAGQFFATRVQLMGEFTSITAVGKYHEAILDCGVPLYATFPDQATIDAYGDIRALDFDVQFISGGAQAFVSITYRKPDAIAFEQQPDPVTNVTDSQITLGTVADQVETDHDVYGRIIRVGYDANEISEANKIFVHRPIQVNRSRSAKRFSRMETASAALTTLQRADIYRDTCNADPIPGAYFPNNNLPLTWLLRQIELSSQDGGVLFRADYEFWELGTFVIRAEEISPLWQYPITDPSGAVLLDWDGLSDLVVPGAFATVQYLDPATGESPSGSDGLAPAKLGNGFDLFMAYRPADWALVL